MTKDQIEYVDHKFDQIRLLALDGGKLIRRQGKAYKCDIDDFRLLLRQLEMVVSEGEGWIDV